MSQLLEVLCDPPESFCSEVFVHCCPPARGGGVDDTTGPGTPVDTTGTGTVQRGTLTVRASFDLADQNIVSKTGMNVEGVTVRIQRQGSAEPPKSALTDASGTATFTDLLQGNYTISVDRPLSPTELERLDVEDRDVSVFAGGSVVTLTPPSRTAPLTLVASRRGSVILSEFHNNTISVGGSAYSYAHYFEVYNNSDSTIYLDGMLLLRRPHVPLGNQSLSTPCSSVNVETRLDPDGIWAISIYAFPGTGKSHPIQPGEAQVVAVDAADHRFAGLPDLSRAHFEFIGTEADPDNPSAANMIRLRGVLLANLGHGESIISGSLYALALPVVRDTSELLSTTILNGTTTGTVFRVPRSAILDAVGVQTTVAHELTYGTFFPCVPFADPYFERSPARLMDGLDPRPMRRKSLGRTATGREILQRTKTSSRDFEQTSPLQRSLAK